MIPPPAESVSAPSLEPPASPPPPGPPHPRGSVRRDGFGARATLVLSLAVLVVLLGAWYGVSIALDASGKGGLLPMPHEMITRGVSDAHSAGMFVAILAVCLVGAALFAVFGRLSRVALDSPHPSHPEELP